MHPLGIQKRHEGGIISGRQSGQLSYTMVAQKLNHLGGQPGGARPDAQLPKLISGHGDRSRSRGSDRSRSRGSDRSRSRGSDRSGRGSDRSGRGSDRSGRGNNRNGRGRCPEGGGQVSDGGCQSGKRGRVIFDFGF